MVGSCAPAKGSRGFVSQGGEGGGGGVQDFCVAQHHCSTYTHCFFLQIFRFKDRSDVLDQLINISLVCYDEEALTANLS